MSAEYIEIGVVELHRRPTQPGARVPGTSSSTLTTFAVASRKVGRVVRDVELELDGVADGDLGRADQQKRAGLAQVADDGRALLSVRTLERRRKAREVALARAPVRRGVRIRHARQSIAPGGARRQGRSSARANAPTPAGDPPPGAPVAAQPEPWPECRFTPPLVGAGTAARCLSATGRRAAAAASRVPAGRRPSLAGAARRAVLVDPRPAGRGERLLEHRQEPRERL